MLSSHYSWEKSEEEIMAAGTQHICSRFLEHIDPTIGFHNLIEVVHTQVHPLYNNTTINHHIS
jgi:hypothetical protein